MKLIVPSRNHIRGHFIARLSSRSPGHLCPASLQEPWHIHTRQRLVTLTHSLLSASVTSFSPRSCVSAQVANTFQNCDQNCLVSVTFRVGIRVDLRVEVLIERLATRHEVT